MFAVQALMSMLTPSVISLAALAMRNHSSRATVASVTLGSMDGRCWITSLSSQMAPMARHAASHEPPIGPQTHSSPGGGGEEGGEGCEGGDEGGGGNGGGEGGGGSGAALGGCGGGEGGGGLGGGGTGGGAGAPPGGKGGREGGDGSEGGGGGANGGDGGVGGGGDGGGMGGGDGSGESGGTEGEYGQTHDSYVRAGAQQMHPPWMAEKPLHGTWALPSPLAMVVVQEG